MEAKASTMERFELVHSRITQAGAVAALLVDQGGDEGKAAAAVVTLLEQAEEALQPLWEDLREAGKRRKVVPLEQ